VGAARPSAPQSSNIKSGIAKGVRSTVNDPATRPEEEEGEGERKRTRQRKRKRTLRFEKVLLPTRSSLIQAGSSGSKSFAHPRGGPVGRNSPCRPPCYASACAMNNSCFAQFMFRNNHMSTWMREDLTELQLIQLSFDVSCFPRIATPVARHGQWSGRV